MSRTARLASKSGIYHVTSRGAGKRDLFEDDRDREYYLTSLHRCSHEENLDILAWCLMDNHVHILCEGDLGDLTSTMKRLNTSYAQHFNGRHGHVGPVFQGRFASCPVESEAHLIETVRYIHLNPRDLGVSNPGDYRWSSYQQYIEGDGFCKVDNVMSIFGSVKLFMDFHDIEKSDVAVVEGIPARPRMTDAEARKIASRIYGEAFSDAIAVMDKSKRNQALRLLYNRGVSIRQLERLTGIGCSAIHRATKKRD